MNCINFKDNYGWAVGDWGITMKIKTETTILPVSILIPPPDTIYTTQGIQDTISIKISSTTDKNIYSYGFTLKFDGSVIQPVSANSSGCITSIWGSPTYKIFSDSIKIAGFGTSALSDSGKLVKVVFDVVGNTGSSTPLQIDNAKLNSGIPTVKIVNGVLCVSDTRFEISGSISYWNDKKYPLPGINVELTGKQPVITENSGKYSFTDVLGGSYYTVKPVRTYSLNNPEIIPYDAALIARYYVGLVTFNLYQRLAGDVNEDNDINPFDAAMVAKYFVGDSIPGMNDKTGWWRYRGDTLSHPLSIDTLFYTSLNSDQKNSDFGGVLLGDVDGSYKSSHKNLPIISAHKNIKSTTDIIVTVHDTAVDAESTFLLPIYTSDVTGKNIFSYGGYFTYDSSIVEALEAISTNTICSTWGIPTFNISSDSIKVAGFGTSALSNCGILVYLKFKAKGNFGKSTVVNCVDFKYNAGSPSSVFIPGKIRILVPEDTPIIDTICSYKDTIKKVFSDQSRISIKFNSGNITGKTVTICSEGCTLSDKVSEKAQIESTNINSVTFFNIECDISGNYSADLIIGYTDEMVTRAGLTPGSEKDSLTLAYFNTSDNKFHTVPTIVNTQKNEAKATVHHFSVWVLGNKNNPIIPVELSSFKSAILNHNIQLTWTTLSETNNYGFEIERSSDGINFVKIGFVEGNGTTAEEHSYSFVDQDLTSGVYYYRLKQIDFDGSFTYSEILTVEVKIPDSYILEQNYPNPFNPETTIRFQIPAAQRIVLTIYNIQGQKVKTLIDEQMQPGSHSVIWDGIDESGNKVASGIYIYTLQSSTGYKASKKMILIK